MEIRTFKLMIIELLCFIKMYLTITRNMFNLYENFNFDRKIQTCFYNRLEQSITDGNKDQP